MNLSAEEIYELKDELMVVCKGMAVTARKILREFYDPSADVQCKVRKASKKNEMSSSFLIDSGCVENILGKAYPESGLVCLDAITIKKSGMNFNPAATLAVSGSEYKEWLETFKQYFNAFDGKNNSIILRLPGCDPCGVAYKDMDGYVLYEFVPMIGKGLRDFIKGEG